MNFLALLINALGAHSDKVTFVAILSFAMVRVRFLIIIMLKKVNKQVQALRV